MKKLIVAVCLLFATVGTALADVAALTPPVATAAVVEPSAPVNKTGWGPGIVSNLSAFYFDGSYKLFQGGILAGGAYTWNDSLSANMASVGIYAGPQIMGNKDGSTSTMIPLMIYLDLYKIGPNHLGIGIGSTLWQSGKGIKGFGDANKSFFSFGMNLVPTN